MPANWLSNSNDLFGRLVGTLQVMQRGLSQPANLRRLRQVLLVVLALWALLALSRLFWALFPTTGNSLPDTAVVINPVTAARVSAGAGAVDIDRLVAWHLFGELGTELPVASEAIAPQAGLGGRDGIEKGARETRLDLTLRGVMASSDDGLGHAIIEYKSKQQVYAVDDKLPVSGRVVLAKVMPTQVVLDNGGTYELLELFEDSPLDGQALPPPPTNRRASAGRGPAPQTVDKRGDSDATALAQGYRDRLYQNPQSLAEVVSVSAVRENGELLGYRIAPGTDPEQFEQLGFKPGDMVTGINGIALDNPANTVRLYQTMRSASEAVFDLERNTRQLTVSVSLGDVPGRP